MRLRSLFITLILLFSLLPSNFAQQQTVLRHGGTVRTVKFSPVNTSLIASAGDNNIIKLWNSRDDTGTTFRSHNKPVNAVAFSPNGQLLASGGDDWTFKLWNIEQQRNIATLEHITDRTRSQVKDVAFSPDGQLLATAGQHVKLWRINTQTEIATLEHEAYVWALAFSPNGQFLAAGDDGGTVKVWDFKKQRVIAQLEGDPNAVYAVTFSPDSRTLATAGYHGQIKLWSVSNWALHGTLENRGTAHTLDFSADGKVLASTGHSAVTLWSVESGTDIASLTGHSGWVYGTAFSPNGRTLVSSGDDGTVRLHNIETYLQTLQQRETVRLIYFLPNNRQSQPGINTKLDRLIRDVQGFCAAQMQSRGFGRKTFTFETDRTGRAVVHRINGRFTNRYYHTETVEKVMAEVDKQLDTSKNIYLIAVDVSSEAIEGENTCGVGGGSWKGTETGSQRRELGGYAIIPASGTCFSVEVTAHELGHAFGLEHDFRNNTHIMSYGAHPDRLSRCAVEWLNVHRYFNANQTAFNEPTTIEMFTPLTLPSKAIHLRFEVTDADTLHQAQLLIPAAIADPASGIKLHSCKSLKNGINLIEFITTDLTRRARAEVTLQVIDVHGNITRQTYALGAADLAQIDVNRDGVVNVADLVLVASHFGKRAVQRANMNPDVNNDGFVDREDLLLVADAIEIGENIPAAPVLTTTNLRGWILEAERRYLGEPNFQRGIAVLKQLLMSLSPTKTALLPNYPNPFNPETWIPYQLAVPGDVTISIYAADGKLVRTLDLGHQAAGIYESRARAVYWDGKNALRESVASGVYFYTLTVNDFTATRRMLIRK